MNRALIYILLPIFLHGVKRLCRIACCHSCNTLSAFCIFHRLRHRADLRASICLDLRGFKSGVVGKLDPKEEGFGIGAEININAIKKGFRIMGVPSAEWKRNSGESKPRTFIGGYVILRTILRNSFRNRCLREQTKGLYSTYQIYSE